MDVSFSRAIQNNDGDLCKYVLIYKRMEPYIHSIGENNLWRNHFLGKTSNFNH